MPAPNKVTLIYRQVGGQYIFTCSEIKGLHFAVQDINESLQSVFTVLSSHASAVYDRALVYKPDGNTFNSGFCRGALEAA